MMRSMALIAIDGRRRGRRVTAEETGNHLQPTEVAKQGRAADRWRHKGTGVAVMEQQ